MIHRRDIIHALNINPKTFSRWCKSGKVPPPDTNINPQSQWWKADTLAKAGIILPSASPTHEASPVVQ